jgi:periplasmic divalent cation tolerance protein
MNQDYILVLMTAPSTDIAQKIATTLVAEGLAACVNIISPIQSIYTWQGKTNDDTEILLIAKSRAAIFQERLVPAVRSIHPYQVPEISAIPILMGGHDYLQWMDETIRED